LGEQDDPDGQGGDGHRSRARHRKTKQPGLWGAGFVVTDWNSTERLVEILSPLSLEGISLQKALLRVTGPFPVAGYARWGDDWLAPRCCPLPHVHRGLDILAAPGTPLVAVEDGYVSQKRVGGATGLGVEITDGNGVQYFYAHLSAFAEDLQPGRRVRQGQVVGYVGETGNAQGTVPHLHLEVQPAGIAVPPKPYVDQWLVQAEMRAIRWVKRVTGRSPAPEEVQRFKLSRGRAHEPPIRAELANLTGPESAVPVSSPWPLLGLAALLGLSLTAARLRLAEARASMRTGPALPTGLGRPPHVRSVLLHRLAASARRLRVRPTPPTRPDTAVDGMALLSPHRAGNTKGDRQDVPDDAKKETPRSLRQRERTMIVCSECAVPNEPGEVFCVACGIFLAWFGENLDETVQHSGAVTPARMRDQWGTSATPSGSLMSDPQLTVVIPEVDRETAPDTGRAGEGRPRGPGMKRAEMWARAAEARAVEAKVRALEAEARAEEAETRAREAESRAAQAAIRTIEAEARTIEAVVQGLRAGVSTGDRGIQRPEGTMGAAGEGSPADGHVSGALPLSLRMLSVATAIALLLLIAVAAVTPWLGDV
jgi:hypothetical protein